VYVALFAGHQLGDYPIQRDDDAQAKGIPVDDLLAAGVPWHTGLINVTRHVGSYLACQAIALALLALVAPLTWPGVWTALTVSGATHAVIDRRWIVRAIIRRLGGCAHWPGAQAQIDQALHFFAMFLAAIGAALLTTVAGALGVTVAGVALIAAALLWERRHGRLLADRLVPTGHR
jgi:hypothetical protein